MSLSDGACGLCHWLSLATESRVEGDFFIWRARVAGHQRPLKRKPYELSVLSKPIALKQVPPTWSHVPGWSCEGWSGGGGWVGILIYS